MVAAQGRVRPPGEAVGVLWSSSRSERAESVDQHGVERLERVLLDAGISYHSVLVFT